jgi:hypothetical protein
MKILLVSFLILIFGACKSVSAQEPMVPHFTIPVFLCGDYSEVSEDLLKSHGEVPVLKKSFRRNSLAFIFFENKTTGTWTLGLKGKKQNSFCIVFVSDMDYNKNSLKRIPKGRPIKYVPRI